MASPSKRPYARGFAVDAQTERALRAGLPGREVKIQRGPLKTALHSLATEPPARLVFVDLDGVPDPEEAAVQLTEICAFETALVAIGSTDTAQFSRALLQRGISDYLVKPISAAAVREASAAAMGEAPEQPYAGRVVAFAGSPGSGTSTLAAAAALGIAADGRAVSVVDLDPVSSKVSALFETHPSKGLPELFAALEEDASEDGEAPVDLARLAAVATPVAAGVTLVGYAQDGPLPGRPSPPALFAMLRHLANQAHVVLVTGVSEPGLQLELMRWCNARVLVYEPTMASISAAVHRLSWLGIEHPATLIQCLPRMRRYALSTAHVRYALAERSPDVVVPHDPAFEADSLTAALDALGKPCRQSLARIAEIVGRNPGL